MIDALVKEVPAAQITPTPVGGNTGIFEISVNGQVVHSKHKGDGVVNSGNLTAFMDKVRAAAK